MAKKKNKKRGRIVKVDFTGVKAGGARVPDGDYRVRVVDIEERVSENSGQPYLNWELEIVGGEYDGATIYHTTSLQKQALFNLRATLEALGLDVPESAMEIDLDALIGLEMGVTVEVQEVQGRKRSRVVDVFSLEELEGDDDDDEDDEDEDTEDDEEEDEEDDEDDDDEEEDEEEEAEEDDEEEEEDDEEDDEDDDRPRKKSSSKPDSKSKSKGGKGKK